MSTGPPATGGAGSIKKVAVRVESVDAGAPSLKKPVWVVVGVIVALLGLLFTLQGVGVMKGSSMSNTTFWAVAGPIIIIVGIALAGVGIRGRSR